MSSSLETLTLDHLPPSYQVHLALFRNLQNAAFLHQQLISRNTDFEYAFIDASVVFSRLQLLTAVYKSSLMAANNTLKTPNVHSEIVAALSASNNISEAYRRFGISPATKDLVVVKVTFPTDRNPQPPSGDAVWDHLKANVEGEAVSPTDLNLAEATDSTKVRKYYKLNGLKWLDDIREAEAKRKETEMLVIGAMSLRGV